MLQPPPAHITASGVCRLAVCNVGTPSSSKDGEALRKFPRVDDKVNVLRELKAGEALESLTIYCYDLRSFETALFLPTPMAVSHLCARIAEH